MIRAGRAPLVRTLADLAATAGKTAKTFSNQKLHKRPGHPEPVSSPQARVLLWDGEQIDAYHAHQPVPPLPKQDRPDDLLDRNEAAALVGIAPRTWDRYTNLPGIQPRPDPVDVAGVEHWQRSHILQWLVARPGPHSSPGRPAGARDTTPRASIPGRTAELLERDPTLTAAQAATELGVTPGTAQRALAHARTAVVRSLLQENPDLTAEEIHDLLGFPVWAARRALNAATKPKGKAAGPKAE